MTDTRLTDNLAHAFYFLPPLQGNERSLVAFLSWPYELTNAKRFFKILLLVSTRFPLVSRSALNRARSPVEPTFSISTITVMAGSCWSKLIDIKPATVTDAYVYRPKAAATTPVKTRRAVYNPIRYERMLCT